MITVAPLQDAVAKLSDRTPIGSKLKSADWEGIPLALRERAFFSAQVEKAKQLQAMKDILDRAITLTRNPDGTFANRSTFIGDMKKQLAALGYASDPDLKGTLQDLTSRARLGLIYDQQIRSAQGYAEWKTGQDQGALDAYPAQELIRVASRRVPRQWHSRWIDAGGPTPDGRLIALKSDPIWSKISRFGVPWPPFDFQSGMGLRDISRQEAEQLGLIAPEDKPVRPDIPFNDNLQASLKNISPQYRQGLEIIFGDTIDITTDIVKWKAQPGHLLHLLFDAETTSGNQRAIQAIKETNNRLSDIVRLPEGPIIPLRETNTFSGPPPSESFIEGEYHPNEADEHHIRLARPTTTRGQIAHAHEIGHYLDELLNGGTGFATENTGQHKDLTAVLQQIEVSQGKANSAKRDADEGGIYWSDPSELFARAFAQWASLRLKDPRQLRHLAIKARYLPHAAWETADFEPIAKAMDHLLANKGLTR
jgi:hypothetical protein